MVKMAWTERWRASFGHPGDWTYRPGYLPKDLEDRGVLDPEILPEYPYRDDGLLIHNAIENHVRRVVEQNYCDEKNLLEDFEVQAWANDLTGDPLLGCNIKRWRDKHDLLKHLPTKDLWMQSVLFSKLLTDRKTNGLADFNAKFQYDPIAGNSREQFLRDLRKTAISVMERELTPQISL